METGNSSKTNGCFAQLIFIVSSVSAFVFAPVLPLFVLSSRSHHTAGSFPELGNALFAGLIGVVTLVLSIFCILSSLSLAKPAEGSTLTKLSFWFSFGALVTVIVAFAIAYALTP